MGTIMFRSFEEINSFKVYSYQHIDDCSAIISPEIFYNSICPFIGGETVSLEPYLEKIKELLRTNGWEGDGELGVIWIPPFVDIGSEDGWGTYLWHVKQSNNGTSWLASGCSLDFERIKMQN